MTDKKQETLSLFEKFFKDRKEVKYYVNGKNSLSKKVKLLKETFI